MLRLKRESPYPALAAEWGAPGARGPDLLAATRGALAAVCPDDLPEVAPLAEALLARLPRSEERDSARRALFALLDRVRRRAFTAILEPEAIEPWTKLVLRIVREADYGFGDLLRSREETDPRTVALRVLGRDACELTVADLSRRTRAIARGILALAGGDPDVKVAILSEVGLDAALCDLACLSNGIVDFPLPANAVAGQVVYMLRHSGARILLASDDEQVAKVLPSLAALPELREVVVFSKAVADRNGLLSLEQMVSQGSDFDDDVRASRSASVRATDVASVMYTSGTTGRPKGIVFTHENVVSKRFCRGFALPNVNEGDVFLSYLPPYHTFGRFLELCGTLFWGATYVFARSTAQATLLEDFQQVRPTVFISVPKKWMELHEAAVWEAGTDGAEAVAAHLRNLTGGRLRYGLSAAGYLDPAVFRAFHASGTALCSGYGMTEATGGITMTPPGEYFDHSIGVPLPGIECRFAEGELLVRGPYVSPGYHPPGPEEPGVDAEGWFPTGDLVSVDPSGHMRIVGRRKEIYKNRQGQTIAPQRVENLFRDFDAVSQAFLVGDQREYNTLLVSPNPASPTMAGRAPGEIRALLSSIVASANRFLAPFERVVAFEVLPRPLDEEHGELTHKLSFKRDVVERNWKPVIDRMYEQRNLALPVEGAFLRVPNWVLREIGVLRHDVSIEGGELRAGSRSLKVGAVAEAPGSVLVGDLAYATDGSVVDLGALLSRPELWLGNEALRTFLGDAAFASLVARRRKTGGGLRLDPRHWAPIPADRLGPLLELVDGEPSLRSIHAAGELLRGERPEARRAVLHLHLGLAMEHAEYAALCRALLRRAADAPEEDVRRRAFRALLPSEDPADTVGTLRLFLDRMDQIVLRDEDLTDLGERGLSEAQLEVLVAHLSSEKANAPLADASDRRLLVGSMRLATATAIAHPTWFTRVRVPLARLALHEDFEIAARALEELDRLRRGFWNWIGPNLRLAIDPGSGARYGWKDVLVFEENVAPAEAEHLLRTIDDSTLVRGSVFLLGGGALISLADVPPRSATVSLLGRRHGKNVYRLSLRTRANETYDVAINVAEDMNFAEFKEEVAWLLAAGADPPLVEHFGGCFAEWGIFTEEFIPGETVEGQVARLVRHAETKRLGSLWPFLAWTALDGHVRFWDRTGRRLALREPSPAAFIVPSHDYQTGARIVSISDRTPCTTLDELLDRFQTSFVARIEASRPELRGVVDDAILLSAVVEALGRDRGVGLLSQAAHESPRRAVAIETFLERVREEGFTPRRPWFAVQRYHRWLEVNPEATVEARGRMLDELWGTYGLSEVERAWPDTRLRFFRNTVFREARKELTSALDRLVLRARTTPGGIPDLEEQVAALRGAIAPTAEEDWFLARMTYRYLAPTDEVSLISMPAGGSFVTEVVAALADAEGKRFTVRGPVTPREVARLLHMFHDANLDVSFTAEHEFLLCFDESETPIGGLFYRRLGPDRIHMEKLVVARRHRGEGIADGLMGEFFRRLLARDVKRVETGYFQPETLSRYGFHTDPTSGGLVRGLEPDAAGAQA